jgi:DNA mismatch endonuclease (patch repair protein)
VPARDTPAASDRAARVRMTRQRRRDTAPELALRRELHRRGRRFRVDLAPLPGLRRRADLVFPRQRLAVYVDGCFWHCCPQHATRPKANTDWWSSKLAANVDRDRDTDRRLARAGWRAVRVWEHEPVESAVLRVLAALADFPAA